MWSWQMRSSSSVVTPGFTNGATTCSTSAARRPASRIFSRSAGVFRLIMAALSPIRSASPLAGEDAERAKDGARPRDQSWTTGPSGGVLPRRAATLTCSSCPTQEPKHRGRLDSPDGCPALAPSPDTAWVQEGRRPGSSAEPGRMPGARIGPWMARLRDKPAPAAGLPARAHLPRRPICAILPRLYRRHVGRQRQIHTCRQPLRRGAPQGVRTQ